jgi:general secretion pathway protein F
VTPLRFRVTALDAGRSVVEQDLDAQDAQDAERQALTRGLRVLSVREQWLRKGSGTKLSLVQFSNELVALLEAGLSLVEGIEALTEKERDPSVRRLLESIRRRLYEGQSLSTALADAPSSFSPLYVATVRASEKTGSIPEALRRFVTYQQQIDQLRKKLVNASIYPLVLLAVGSLVVVFLLAYVVPRFAGIYEDIGGELPLASEILLRWGKLLDAHGPAVLGVFLGLVGLAAYGVARPGLRTAAFRLLTRIPAIGRQVETYQLARLYRTVGMLLRGGLPAVTALEMTGGLLSQESRPRLSAATRAVREGRSLGDALSGERLTTPVADRMLRVGERSGNMGEMMERVSAFYDEELSRFFDVATRLIEPAMMTVIGLVVGAIVVLMYFPIFELAGSIR